MILIYVPRINNRVRYIFNLVFRELLKTDFQMTTQPEEFDAFDGVKINYSRQRWGNELFFSSADLLFEAGIMGQELNFFDYEGSRTFYPVYNRQSCLPFDPFAAAFYLVTRYEEYLPYMKDPLGRFPAKESCAFQQGFLQKPLVNHWVLKIASVVEAFYPGFRFPAKKYRFIPTIDVDAYYAYKLKGLVRTVGGYWKSLIERNHNEIFERTRVLLGISRDPFDTFQYQWDLQNKYNIRHIYFILFADYGQYDKNLPVYNPKFQTLIKGLADYADVGIHPSFASNNDQEKLKEEVDNLTKILYKDITKSRQHFLKLNLPGTYRNLINLDITDDYTMGYAAEAGFRAGICDAFLFYDLDQDVETKLRVHPFALMEGTYRDYNNVNAEEALEKMLPLIAEVKAVNGTLITLWHNESLSNKKRWTGWQQVYEAMIRAALP